MRIMLVDDDVLLRDMYKTKFTEAGDVVVTAENGNDALDQLEDDRCDVVLMDMVMPSMSGVKLIKEIKKMAGPASKAHCIVLSNQSEPDDINAATNAGAIGYIIKAECIPSEVVKKVHKLVKK